MREFVCYSDGGARGNPGPSAIGVVVLNSDGNTLEEVSEYIGEATNNQAEYRAVIEAMERALGLGATKVKLFLDSELIVRQLTGKYKVKNEGLIPLFGKVLSLSSEFEHVDFQHVAREKNKRADALVNKALDKELKSTS